MRKRQRKVQDFQAGLKVGDRVITTGGIYGQITGSRTGRPPCSCRSPTRSGSKSPARSIGGYQGQEPVVQSDGGNAIAHVQEPSLESDCHRRRDTGGGGAVRAALEEDPPGPRPPGRRAPRAQSPDRRRAAGRDGDVVRAAARRAQEREGAGDGRQDSRSHVVFRRGRDRRTRTSSSVKSPISTSGTSFDRDSLAGTYTFKMKPNIERDRRTEAVQQAIQTIDRRVNELGVSEPLISRYRLGRRSDHRRAAGSDQCRARERNHQEHGAARAEAGRGGPGA